MENDGTFQIGNVAVAKAGADMKMTPDVDGSILNFWAVFRPIPYDGNRSLPPLGRARRVLKSPVICSRPGAKYLMVMRSKNAEFLKDSLIEQARKMTPKQRVHAYIEHSRQMRAIAKAGSRRRRMEQTKSDAR